MATILTEQDIVDLATQVHTKLGRGNWSFDNYQCMMKGCLTADNAVYTRCMDGDLCVVPMETDGITLGNLHPSLVIYDGIDASTSDPRVAIWIYTTKLFVKFSSTPECLLLEQCVNHTSCTLGCAVNFPPLQSGSDIMPTPECITCVKK